MEPAAPEAATNRQSAIVNAASDFAKPDATVAGAETDGLAAGAERSAQRVLRLAGRRRKRQSLDRNAAVAGMRVNGRRESVRQFERHGAITRRHIPIIVSAAALRRAYGDGSVTSVRREFRKRAGHLDAPIAGIQLESSVHGVERHATIARPDVHVAHEVVAVDPAVTALDVDTPVETVEPYAAVATLRLEVDLARHRQDQVHGAVGVDRDAG